MSDGVGKRKDRKRTILFLAVVLTGIVFASGGCGGGGGGDAPATFTLSGTITAPTGIEIDSDVNDPNENYVANDSFDTAQTISNPVSLGGYVNEADEGPDGQSKIKGDRDDYFRVSLNSGDRIFLAIGDHQTGDLELYIYPDSTSISEGDWISRSIGIGPSESLDAPGSGTYIVNVYAERGASNYILTIGPNLGGAGHDRDALSTEHDFMPGQAIVRFAETPQIAASAHALSGHAADLGMQMAAGGPGRAVLLTFEENYQRNDADRALAIDDRKSFGRTADGKLQRKRDTLQVIKALRKRPDVLSADPNYIMRHYATIPNDTYYHLQWHYPIINLPQAWDITTGTSTGAEDVIVAVVDTGVLMGHPDLAGQLTSDGYDFISNTSISRDGDGIDDDPDDPGDSATPGASSFHGTHCAGTIAAASNNAKGLAGVSWGAKIMPIRVLGKGGGTFYDIMQGVRYAAGLPNDSGTIPDRRADIISMSLGGGGYSPEGQELFNEVRDAGVILIAAAGNEAVSTPSYPASYDGVISVSAVGIDSTLASYSNYGAYIDVTAPGGDSGDLNGDGYPDLVWSTCGNDSTGSIIYNYTLQAGTSMATPHVAGVVALMKAVRPGLTPDELDAFMQSGALTKDIGIPGRDDLYGHGLIDAYKAVLAAQDTTPVTTVLKVDPITLNFGMNTTTATLTVSKVGSGSLSVTDYTPNPDLWLTVIPGSVDADGLGSYTVTANRNSLPDGTHRSAITFTPSSGSPVVVPVNLQVISASGSADAGFHYVLLLHPTTYAAIAQDSVAAVNGSYTYTFTGVPAGSYLIVAGSDRDNDGYIDNPGESLGAYNSLDQITAVVVDRNLTNLNFATDLRFSLPAAGAPSTTLNEGAIDTTVFKRIR